MRVFKATYRDRKGKVCESAKWYVEFRDHLERVRRLPAKNLAKIPVELKIGRKQPLCRLARSTLCGAFTVASR